MVNASGAATHSVAIAVPPPIAGVGPRLSLDYSSQSQENGFLGLGWSLGGLSSIERCPATVVQDGFKGGINYDANDRFCLDGMRLIAVTSGTYGADGMEYRTEIDMGIRVVSYGSIAYPTGGSGPSYFMAWAKSGDVMEFGNTPDSKIEAQGKTSVRLWALNKKSDANTNYFTVTYTEDNTNGDYRPDRIDYTGNVVRSVVPNRSVQFVYEAAGARPTTDLTPIYIGGSVVKSMRRLTNIQTFVNTGLVKDYRLAYEERPTTKRSALIQVQECAELAPSPNCLPKKQFSWQLDGFYEPYASNCQADCVLLHTANYGWGNYVADFNGDGKTDILGTFSDGTAVMNLSVSSQATGVNFQSSFWNFPTYDLNLTCNWVGDFNGDGKADMARYIPGDQSHLGIYLSTGSNFTPNSWAAQLRSTSPANEPTAMRALLSKPNFLIRHAIFSCLYTSYRIRPSAKGWAPSTRTPTATAEGS
jgi:hypothetical protein